VKKAAVEARFLARDEPGELQVARTEGSFVFDEKGRRYIDFMMGWCVGNFGWGNAVLVKEPKTFHGPDYVYPGYSYAPWAELAKLLVSIAPPGLTKAFRATGGSEAVDLALQAAMIHTGQRGFISLEESYHGNSLGGLSVGDSEKRERVRNLLPHCYKIKPPLNEQALDKVERRLKGRNVAAFIMEPISINLGVLIPEERFMQGLQRLCRKYGTLLIADEVATGFGRTGKLFASEHFDLRPDIMCVAKAITGGLGGMGATLMTAPVAKSMEEHGSFYSTYGWHPRSVDVSIAAMRYIIKHEKRLLRNAVRLSDYIAERLSQIPFKGRASIHRKGLAFGIELEDERYASQLQEKSRRRGLLFSHESASTLLLLPALNMERSVAEKGLDILESCV
jgi:acetylornithine/succinyldiaminopimelate/putrescine aminotransferase